MTPAGSIFASARGKAYLLKCLVIALPILLGAMLISTIYFTLFDLEWIAFLAGVLLAAVAAMASQTAKSHWLVLRRTRQFERVKETLAAERVRIEYCTRAMETAELRFRTINDALSTIIVFIDRDERCRYHNRAFQKWCGRSNEMIDGLPLHALVGDEIYCDLRERGLVARTGTETRYTAVWPTHDGGREDVSVVLTPYPVGIDGNGGFYALVERVAGVSSAHAAAAAEEHAAPHAESIGDVAILSQGREQTVYMESMAARLVSDGDPRRQLMRALEEDQFLLFAQKIRSLTAGTARTPCVEVLLRLKEEEDNMLLPGGFFPVAERYNLMGEIDRWVVRNLLKWASMRRYADAGWTMPMYCLNLSAAALADRGFPRYVQRQLEHFTVEGVNLCFEIGEPDLRNHNWDVRVLMNVLKPLGCRFSVAGVGHTGVPVLLKGLAFDFLKMDGMLIQSIGHDQAAIARIRAIVAECKALGVCTIAEFVETDDTLAALRAAGVDYAQGFGVSKPGPILIVSSSET